MSRRDHSVILDEFLIDDKATKLDLTNCELTNLPSLLHQICLNYPNVAERIHILNLAHNQLSDLPSWLTLMPNLSILFCLDNNFTQIPQVLRKMNKCTMISFKNCNISGVIQANDFPKDVEWLILTGNNINGLSDDFPTTCSRIRKFMLSNNQMNHLPKDFHKLKYLELLRIANNNFKDVPIQCFNCPQLKWLALGGNPCLENLIQLPNLEDVPEFDKFYNDNFAKPLGSGTSGNVISAFRKSDSKKVAAKIFKSNEGSDGRALDEVAISLVAKNIPGLIHAEHAAKRGNQLMLITKLVAGEPNALANPPSFESCTRSVYDEKLELSHKDGIHIIETVRNALDALHKRGITHGDVYGHNILVGKRQKDGNLSVVLGDLGAAWPFPKEITNLVRALELKALKVLEDEVMQRIIKHTN